MSSDPALASYFQDAISWDADRAARLKRSSRVAWILCTVACTFAVMLAAALLLLMPLKRVEPFVVRVDNSTGVVDVVPVFSGGAPQSEAVTRYFLSHYVTVCERFNHSTAESDYEECGAFHTPQRNQQWYAAWARGNPASPLNVYRDGTTLRVQVTSVSFFTRGNGVSDLAHVRYIKGKRTGGGEEHPSHWIATVQYTYGEPSKDARMRRWNPLGFKIVEFHAQAEVLDPSAPVSAVMATQSSAGAGS